MLQPIFALEKSVQIVCREARSSEAFLGDLAVQAVDVVLSDAPAAPSNGLRVFDHLLGECGTAFFAAPGPAKSLRRRFPHSLHGAPFLLPGNNSALRRPLEKWFEDQHLEPTVVAEVEDTALAKVFGEAALGVFAVPDVVEEDVRARYKVALVGRAPEVRQRFYAISVERKVKHPAVVAICDGSREKLFA
jgi:LysR family transcriptional activator of nhaA